MEEFSLTTKEEADSDKPGSDKKKKKRAEALGAFLVETKPEATAAKRKETDNPEPTRPLPDKRHEKAGDAEAGHDVAETERPFEELSPEEIAVVRRLTAEAKLAALQESVNGKEGPEAAYGDLLVEDFLEQVAHEALEPDDALDNTLAEAGIEHFPQAESAEPEEPDEPEADPALPDDEPREFTEQEAEIYLHETAAQPDDYEQVEESGAGDSGGAPPPPPIRPTARGGGDDRPPRRPRRPLRGAAPGGFDSALHQALPDRLRTEYLSNYNESGLLDAALVGGSGGVLGYLMGRRRGRIKTEKKLLPVQRRLEKQVKALQGELQVNETKLRKLAARRVRAQGPVVIERFKEKVANRPPKTEVIEPMSIRQAAPEARQLHSQKRAPEHLGHMVVVAEAKPAVVHEKRMEKTAERPQKPGETIIKIEKNIATMNRAELLEVSDKIVIDGASLRQIYETRLVGERGLRRLVSEHLRGGNVKKLLRREIIEREIDFERDPAMRDQAALADDSAGGASLKSMLDRAGASKTGSAEEAAFYKARAAYDARARTVQRRQRRLIDVSMTATIAVLIVLILLLLLSRH